MFAYRYQAQLIVDGKHVAKRVNCRTLLGARRRAAKMLKRATFFGESASTRIVDLREAV